MLFCTSDHIDNTAHPESLRQETGIAKPYMFLAMSIIIIATTLFLASPICILAVFSCPHWSFTNVSITPCNYNELIMITKYSQSTKIVSLPDEYFLKVVVGQDTSPSLCILHGTSSSNTSYTLQLSLLLKKAHYAAQSRGQSASRVHMSTSMILISLEYLCGIKTIHLLTTSL